MLNFYLLWNLLKIYKNINLHLAFFGKSAIIFLVRCFRVSQVSKGGMFSEYF